MLAVITAATSYLRARSSDALAVPRKSATFRFVGPIARALHVRPEKRANLFDFIVEAAGIEPASGSLQPTDPTCVVRVACVGPRPNTDNLARPQPGKSRRTSPRRRGSASPHSDGPSPAHGPRPGGPRTRTV